MYVVRAYLLLLFLHLSLVTNDKFYSFQTLTAEPLEETDPGWPYPLSYLRRHLKLHGIHPH